jgi:hypothetical protein
LPDYSGIWTSTWLSDPVPPYYVPPYYRTGGSVALNLHQTGIQLTGTVSWDGPCSFSGSITGEGTQINTTLYQDANKLSLGLFLAGPDSLGRPVIIGTFLLSCPKGFPNGIPFVKGSFTPSRSH